MQPSGHGGQRMGPARTHLVLIGGGHAHVAVIRSFGMKPEPGVVVTVIAKELEAPYSGMLPGLVAGHYTDDECHIDVVRLAAWAGARLIHGAATHIDRAAKEVHVAGRAPIRYDLLSIDVGITPLLDGMAGAAQHVIPVKPISSFVPRWRALERAALERDGPRRIAVIGSGAAGFELILAMRHRLRALAAGRGIDADAFRFVLVGGERLLPRHNAWARALGRRELAAQKIEMVEGDHAVEITAGRIRLASGRTIDADAVMASTKAGPAQWFRSSGLPLDPAGFIAVKPTLQLIDDDDVFAVGDCAAVLEYPREKAGVFAVRQGPPLTGNLRRRARGMVAEPFVPQSDFLTLLSTGGKHAIGARGPLAIGGDWVWRWKDKIDQDFMHLFNDLPPMPSLDGMSADDMRCAGCAAKIGPVTLRRALDRLASGDAGGARDDAAVIDTGGETLRLDTIDFFRAFWPEPYLLGAIAANHAMSDIYAMGGRPTHALANVVLPYAEPRRVEDDLYQLLAGARAVFEREGVRLDGGHSSEGAEMAAGFFVSGSVARGRLLRKAGLRPGDRLILTRPIGTGILFAAQMRGRARSAAIDAALTAMQGSLRPVATVLERFDASACSDVTGFGLAGHLVEMLEASSVAAELSLADVPLYPSVLEHADAGIASSLLQENIRLSHALDGAAAANPRTRAVLFDPQTAGGLLFGLAPEQAVACIAALHAAGAGAAAIIGTVGDIKQSDGQSAVRRIRLTGDWLLAERPGARVAGKGRHERG